MNKMPHESRRLQTGSVSARYDYCGKLQRRSSLIRGWIYEWHRKEVSWITHTTHMYIRFVYVKV